MNDLTKLIYASAIAWTLALSGCGDGASGSDVSSQSEQDGHVHGPDGQDHHDDVDETHEDHGHGGETPLDPITIDGMTVELAQGHGRLEPGKELHLVVKLPYSDNGATVIRAWLGADDRFASVVAKAEYAPSHDDYDIHAVAPDPLPENTMWWIEIEKPDGEKLIGSARPN